MTRLTPEQRLFATSIALENLKAKCPHSSTTICQALLESEADLADALAALRRVQATSARAIIMVERAHQQRNR